MYSRKSEHRQACGLRGMAVWRIGGSGAQGGEIVGRLERGSVDQMRLGSLDQMWYGLGEERQGKPNTPEGEERTGLKG